MHKLRFGELDMVVLYKENKVNNIYKLLIDIYTQLDLNPTPPPRLCPALRPLTNKASGEQDILKFPVALSLSRSAALLILIIRLEALSLIRILLFFTQQ